MTDETGSGADEPTPAPGSEPTRTKGATSGRRTPRAAKKAADEATATGPAAAVTGPTSAAEPRPSRTRSAGPARRPRAATPALAGSEAVAEVVQSAPSPAPVAEPVVAEPVVAEPVVAEPVVAEPAAASGAKPAAASGAKRARKAGAPSATASAASPAPTTSTSIGEIESSTPGRTRVRVKPELRTPEAMARIQGQLSEHGDVSDVTVNARTGSIVIRHDAARHGSSIIRDVVKDSELIGGTVLDIPEDGGDYAKMDQRLADMGYQAREWLYARTGLRTGGVLLPGVIAGAGVAQILIVGISIEMLPGPILLYIAYDIYRRSRKEPPLQRHPAQPMLSPA